MRHDGYLWISLILLGGLVTLDGVPFTSVSFGSGLRVSAFYTLPPFPTELSYVPILARGCLPLQFNNPLAFNTCLSMPSTIIPARKVFDHASVSNPCTYGLVAQCSNHSAMLNHNSSGTRDDLHFNSSCVIYFA